MNRSDALTKALKVADDMEGIGHASPQRLFARQFVATAQALGLMKFEDALDAAAVIAQSTVAEESDQSRRRIGRDDAERIVANLEACGFHYVRPNADRGDP